MMLAKFVHVSDREILFSPNCSKFAVECDCNSKISQKVHNLGFFGKKVGLFEKKNKNFFSIANCGNFFVACEVFG